VIGKHCSVSDCQQLDFLPFTCDVCRHIFCREHHKYEAHGCTNTKDKRAIVCPLCNTPLGILPFQDPNIVLDDHINSGCTKQGPPSYKCNTRGCKIRELVPFICKKCGVHYCVRHRFEQDHKCPGKPILKKPARPDTTVATKYMHTSSKNIPSNHTGANNIPSTVNLGIRLTDGTVLRQNFSGASRLRDVQHFIDQSRTDGNHPYAMHVLYPRREYTFEDLDKTLVQLKLVPSGMIILQSVAGEQQTQADIVDSSHPQNPPPAEGQGGWWDTIKSFIYSFQPV